MEQDLATQIQQLAYQIWELEGRPCGRERIHWLRAEAVIRERLQPPPAVPTQRLYRVVSGAPQTQLPPLTHQARQVQSRYARPGKG